MSPEGARPQVAVFDFDGTLTRRDTLLPFLAAATSPGRVARALAAQGVTLGLAMAGRGDRDHEKQRLLAALLRGWPLAELEVVAERFADETVERRLRTSSLARLRSHLEDGHAVVIVTASPELVVAPVGRRLGVSAVLGTRLEVTAGRLTGRLLGANVRGAEKVRRLEAWLGPGAAPAAWAYGNSKGDRELMGTAGDAIWVRRFEALRRR